jgi:di/tricarboxylate transporter
VTLEIAFVLALVLGLLVVLVKEWMPADAAGIVVIFALVVAGVLAPRQAFLAFGNDALVTVGAMFVLAAGLIRTGAVAFVGRRILAAGGASEGRLVAVLMVAVAALSTVVNNTPLAVIFLPIVLGLSETSGIPASKLLIPMSYATIVGGMCSLVGTSTNVLVVGKLADGSYDRYDIGPIGMFEPLVLALAGIAMTIAYMVLVGRRLLPARTTVSSSVRGGKIRDYVTELVVPPGSPFAGKSLADAIYARAPALRVLQLIRREEILAVERASVVLEERDVLIVRGEVNALLALERTPGIDVAPELRSPAVEARGRDTTLAELVVRPGAGAIGQRVRDLGLHATHGAAVLAVQRHGVHVREKVGELALRFGDVLLVQADVGTLERLRDSPDFVVVEGIAEEVVFSHKAGFAVAVVVAVMALAATGIARLPVGILALAGAVAMVAGGCLGVRHAYRAIDLRLLVLMAGTIALGNAMETSGAARFVADGVLAVARPLGDVAILSAVYLLANLLTALVSNAAAALVALPIGLAAAEQAGLAGKPFVMAVMFAASIDFSTPIGYQTNTFVYGAGGYRFTDYVRVGVPLNLLWWLLATLLIPVLWPLHG